MRTMERFTQLCPITSRFWAVFAYDTPRCPDHDSKEWDEVTYRSPLVALGIREQWEKSEWDDERASGDRENEIVGIVLEDYVKAAEDFDSLLGYYSDSELQDPNITAGIKNSALSHFESVLKRQQKRAAEAPALARQG